MRAKQQESYKEMVEVGNAVSVGNAQVLSFVEYVVPSHSKYQSCQPIIVRLSDATESRGVRYRSKG
jgi:hypothetical protein